MEKVVYFRDFQEQQAADHNNLQAFARKTFDDLIDAVVTKANRYAGFNAVKSAQAEVTVAPGLFFQAGGAVYSRVTPLVQSMVQYLPAAAQRIVAISVFGQSNDTDVTERDFLVNVDTGETEPQAVAMTSSRDATLVFTAGAESADPQNPPVSSANAVIAYVLLDPTQVVSIAMNPDASVSSTENLDLRAKLLEAFRAAIEPRVSSLASDIAALAQKLAQASTQVDLTRLYEDMARVKERVEIPDTASDYGADRYLTTEKSDVANAQALGYDAKVEEGIRFSDANADESEADIFSANDPNAAKAANGLLLPAYDSIVKMSIGPFQTDLGIAQYGFQTFDIVQKTMSRQRIRYGSTYTYCTNSTWWKSGTYDPVTETFKLSDGETFLVLDPQLAEQDHQMVRVEQYWVDTYTVPYWDFVKTDHSITGAQVAQSFLVSNDMWLTRIGFYLTVKAAAENVILTLCEITNGVPDLSNAILHQVIDQSALVVGDWTRVDVLPTFLKAGSRYAIVLTSNANHKIGMSDGNNFLEGTFFYSTDGSYFQGDLTKDMMLELWGAKFRAAQVTIELKPINLDGGIRSIDILAGTIKPESTDLIYEVQPSGSGDWIPLKPENLDALTSAPVLFHFRARFVGTKDMHAGLMLTGSRVSVSRPKTAFKHVSTPVTLAAPHTNVHVQLLLEQFNDTPHDLTCTIKSGATIVNPSTTSDQVLDASAGRVQRTFTFAPASTSSFIIIINGATNSPADTFHVSERVHWALPG